MAFINETYEGGTSFPSIHNCEDFNTAPSSHPRRFAHSPRSYDDGYIYLRPPAWDTRPTLHPTWRREPRRHFQPFAFQNYFSRAWPPDRCGGFVQDRFSDLECPGTGYCGHWRRSQQYPRTGVDSQRRRYSEELPHIDGDIFVEFERANAGTCTPDSEDAHSIRTCSVEEPDEDRLFSPTLCLGRSKLPGSSQRARRRQNRQANRQSGRTSITSVSSAELGGHTWSLPSDDSSSEWDSPPGLSMALSRNQTTPSDHSLSSTPSRRTSSPRSPQSQAYPSHDFNNLASVLASGVHFDGRYRFWQYQRRARQRIKSELKWISQKLEKLKRRQESLKAQERKLREERGRKCMGDDRYHDNGPRHGVQNSRGKSKCGSEGPDRSDRFGWQCMR
ncbi:MAG: hypothetical protein LQ351_000716 [Letrouitia transgressa]|nr:MAG: hypothetical protein LQ351_000716 [Letrouitia transgressa]